MEGNWHFRYGPPQGERPARDDDWPASYAFLAFSIIGPLIYFGPELRMVEAWIVDFYRMAETWLLPIRDWFLGLFG